MSKYGRRPLFPLSATLGIQANALPKSDIGGLDFSTSSSKTIKPSVISRQWTHLEMISRTVVKFSPSPN